MQDILPNKLTDTADALLPAAAWAEKDGCWENFAGKIQAFAAAIAAAERRDARRRRVLQAARPHGLVTTPTTSAGDGRAVRDGDHPVEDAAEPAMEFVEL